MKGQSALPFDTWVLLPGAGLVEGEFAWASHRGTFPCVLVLACAPGSVEELINKCSDAQISFYKAKPLSSMRSASLAVMLCKCPASCRIVSCSCKLACSPWHSAHGSYSFTHIFRAFYPSVDQRGNQAASPCLLTKDFKVDGVWTSDCRAKGKRHQAALASTQDTCLGAAGGHRSCSFQSTNVQKVAGATTLCWKWCSHPGTLKPWDQQSIPPRADGEKG